MFLVPSKHSQCKLLEVDVKHSITLSSYYLYHAFISNLPNVKICITFTRKFLFWKSGTHEKLRITKSSSFHEAACSLITFTQESDFDMAPLSLGGASKLSSSSFNLSQVFFCNLQTYRQDTMSDLLQPEDFNCCIVYYTSEHLGVN